MLFYSLILYSNERFTFYHHTSSSQSSNVQPLPHLLDPRLMPSQQAQEPPPGHPLPAEDVTLLPLTPLAVETGGV